MMKYMMRKNYGGRKRYQFTVPGVSIPSEDKIAEAKTLAVDIMKKQPKEKQLLEKGVSFRYDYYSLDDEFLFSQEFSIEDLEEK